MSQINTVWEINGHTYELDLQDAETADRYEEAFDIMGEEEKKMPKDGKGSDKIRAYYKLFENLYDRLFGEGSGKAILGEKVNVRICNEVYDNFLGFVAAQTSAALSQQSAMLSKYSPKRAQHKSIPMKK